MSMYATLRAIRHDRNLGQRDIADALDLSVSEVSKLERGKRRIRLDQLPDWCAALGVDLVYLFVQDRGTGMVLARLNDVMAGMEPAERRVFVGMLEALARYAEGNGDN